jgi:hypothetical protein
MSNRIITFTICLFVVPSLGALADDISPLKLLFEAKLPKYTALADNNINAIDTPTVKLLSQLPAVAKVDIRGAAKVSFSGRTCVLFAFLAIAMPRPMFCIGRDLPIQLLLGCGGIFHHFFHPCSAVIADACSS